MSDAVERGKALLAAVGDEGPWTIDSEDGQPIIHEAHHYDSTDDWYDVDGANGGWVAHCEDLPVAEFIASARSLVPELIAEVERLQNLPARLRAYAKDCVHHGDMTPMGARMLNKIADEYDPNGAGDE